MLGDDGKPRPELFLKDGLHMTEAGYAVWTKLILPHLPEPERGN
jgi:lysophospholipase L1-like esterase